MWKFFRSRRYALWAWGGIAFIVALVVSSVQIDVAINGWYGEFYDKLQAALTKPHSVSLQEFIGLLLDFALLAGIWMVIQVVLAFFTSHWTLRWRRSMNYRYIKRWQGEVEGASQRVQEDTLKFARYIEELGVGMLEALLVLLAFIPILWTLSEKITGIDIPGSLVWVALATAVGGTVLLAFVGRRLPGIEYDIQKNEAAYRKHLVHGEDKGMDGEVAHLLFKDVLKIHYKNYLHFLYFNTTKFSFLQFMVIVPYLVLSPTIVAGAVTLGFVTQVARAFNKVAESFQYLVRSWHQIVGLLSVYKRLKEYEIGTSPY